MRTIVSALVVLSAAALLVTGCGGGAVGGRKQAAASALPSGCTASANATDMLWPGSSSPGYYVSGNQVISSSGPVFSLPSGSSAAQLWACGSRPVLTYLRGDTLERVQLGSHRVVGLAHDAVISPGGLLVSFRGTRIGYEGGPALSVHGLPIGWPVTGVIVSPRKPLVFMVETQSPRAGVDECSKGLGQVFRVSPQGSRRMILYNPCQGDPHAAWSPDGASVAYAGDAGRGLYVVDSSARRAPRVLTLQAGVSRLLWSPDGTRIAYEVETLHGSTVSVVDVASGTQSTVASGSLDGWSPDGNEVAVVTKSGSLEAVPARGGPARTLLS